MLISIEIGPMNWKALEYGRHLKVILNGIDTRQQKHNKE